MIVHVLDVVAIVVVALVGVKLLAFIYLMLAAFLSYEFISTVVLHAGVPLAFLWAVSRLKGKK